MCLIEDQSWIDCIDITSRWHTFVSFHLYGNKEVSLPLWPIRPRWFHTYSPYAGPLGDGHEGMWVRFGSQGSIALNWHSRYSGTRYSGTWLYCIIGMVGKNVGCLSKQIPFSQNMILTAWLMMKTAHVCPHYHKWQSSSSYRIFWPLSCWIHFKKQKNILAFFTIDMAQESKSCLVEEKDLFILHSQHHCYWCPGDARS